MSNFFFYLFYMYYDGVTHTTSQPFRSDCKRKLTQVLVKASTQLHFPFSNLFFAKSNSGHPLFCSHLFFAMPCNTTDGKNTIFCRKNCTRRYLLKKIQSRKKNQLMIGLCLLKCEKSAQSHSHRKIRALTFNLAYLPIEKGAEGERETFWERKLCALNAGSGCNNAFCTKNIASCAFHPTQFRELDNLSL